MAFDIQKTWIYACVGITDSNNRTEEYKQTRLTASLSRLHSITFQSIVRQVMTLASGNIPSL